VRWRDRRAPAALLILVAIGSLIAAALAAPTEKTLGLAPAVTPIALPDGPGREILERECMICHSSMLITQQAKDSTGWEKTLATMEKWGSPVQGAEHDTLRTYLLAHFGPKPR
jgi:cytochrome c5